MADPFGLGRSAYATFVKLVGEIGAQKSDTGQLLANAIVEIMSDAALLAIADFEDFTLETFAFGDIPRDTFDLDEAAILLDDPSADLESRTATSRGLKIEFNRCRAGAF